MLDIYNYFDIFSHKLAFFSLNSVSLAVFVVVVVVVCVVAVLLVELTNPRVIGGVRIAAGRLLVQQAEDVVELRVAQARVVVGELREADADVRVCELGALGRHVLAAIGHRLQEAPVAVAVAVVDAVLDAPALAQHGV